MNKTAFIRNVGRYGAVSLRLGTILPIIYDIIPFWPYVCYSHVKNTEVPYKPLLVEGKRFVCYLIFGEFIYFGISD